MSELVWCPIKLHKPTTSFFRQFQKQNLHYAFGDEVPTEAIFR